MFKANYDIVRKDVDLPYDNNNSCLDITNSLRKGVGPAMSYYRARARGNTP